MPSFEVVTVIGRHYRYFLINIVFIMLLFVILAFLALLIDTSDLGSRLSLTITIILSFVAFRFTISDSVPRT